eukprot:m51a1_g14481 hypothetical protein (857) ;mRNA; r:711270-714394
MEMPATAVTRVLLLLALLAGACRSQLEDHTTSSEEVLRLFELYRNGPQPGAPEGDREARGDGDDSVWHLGSLTLLPCLRSKQPQLWCVNISVPVDYEEPSGDFLEVAFVVHRAARNPADPARRRAIVKVPAPPATPAAPACLGATFEGGPGAPGHDQTAFALKVAAATNDAYDIIFVDQRGVGWSCGLGCARAGLKWALQGFGMNRPGHFAVNVAEYEDECRKEILGDPATASQSWQCIVNSTLSPMAQRLKLLPFLGSKYVAADIAALFERSGYSKVWVYGSSYGTVTAQVFGAMYGERWASGLILDSPVKSTISSADWIDTLPREARKYIARSLDLCWQRASCRADYGNLTLRRAKRLVFASFTQGSGWPKNVTFPYYDYAQRRVITLNLLAQRELVEFLSFEETSEVMRAGIMRAFSRIVLFDDWSEMVKLALAKFFYALYLPTSSVFDLNVVLMGVVQNCPLITGRDYIGRLLPDLRWLDDRAARVDNVRRSPDAPASDSDDYGDDSEQAGGYVEEPDEEDARLVAEILAEGGGDAEDAAAVLDEAVAEAKEHGVAARCFPRRLNTRQRALQLALTIDRTQYFQGFAGATYVWVPASFTAWERNNDPAYTPRVQNATVSPNPGMHSYPIVVIGASHEFDVAAAWADQLYAQYARTGPAHRIVGIDGSHVLFMDPVGGPMYQCVADSVLDVMARPYQRSHQVTCAGHPWPMGVMWPHETALPASALAGVQRTLRAFNMDITYRVLSSPAIACGVGGGLVYVNSTGMTATGLPVAFSGCSFYANQQGRPTSILYGKAVANLTTPYARATGYDLTFPAVLKYQETPTSTSQCCSDIRYTAATGRVTGSCGACPKA